VKTRAAILVRLGQELVVDEIEVPRLRRGQVLVEMVMAGVCRTQLNEVSGRKGPDPYLPHLLGHEGTGKILDIGSGVTKVAAGDIVAISWIKGGGLEAPGGMYRWGKKRVHSGSAAVFGEKVVVAENRVTRVPAQVPAYVTAILGCAVATGVGVIQKTLQVRPGSTIAIFGVGGVGGAAVLAARAAGCRAIVAIDVSQKKLMWAAQLGATHFLNVRRVNVLSAMRRQFSEGVDFAVEASGVASVAETALASLSPHGVLAIAGHPGGGETFQVDPFVLIQGRRIVGTWGGETVPDRDFPRYLRAYRTHRLPLEKLIGASYALEDSNAALKALAGGAVGRLLITFNSEQ